MPSTPVSACVRQGDRQILIPCCRYTGGPTTQRVIEELLDLYAPEYGVITGRRELVLCSRRGGNAERMHKGDWLVIDGPIPRVYTPSEYILKYFPMHHSVQIMTIKH